MAEKLRPLTSETAPDPASSYERAKPEKEAGMGRLDNNVSTPTRSPDKVEDAVTHKQEPRQINSHEVVDDRHARSLSELPEQPDHSMKEDEPGDTRPPGQHPSKTVDKKTVGKDEAP